MCHWGIIKRWIRYRSELESCSIASGLDMSPGHISGYTRIWWLSQNLSREEPKNMTQCYFVVHIALAHHQCRRWRLCCEVNSSLLNGRHEFRTQATNRRDMVLANMNIPRISWTCYRMRKWQHAGSPPLVHGFEDPLVLTSFWSHRHPSNFSKFLAPFTFA